jgi:hypothetical protein
MLTTEDSKQTLTTSIRGWIHMDNLVESFTKQATNARSLRAKHEEEAIRTMKQMGLASSTIQVSGASLQIVKRKNTSGLTWGFLDKEIAAWATQQQITPSQVQSLLRWLHEHRETTMTETLKKS